MSCLNITPIGTCRIKAPLGRAQDRYPVRAHFDGIYGLVHTAAEAVQMVRYLQGEKSFDPRSYPSLLNPGVDPDSIGKLQRADSDLFVIEISSAKRITSLGDAHQINYLYRTLPELFSQKSLVSKFWSLAAREERAPLHEFLNGLPVFRDMSDDSKALLRDMRLHIESDEEVAAQMGELVERLGRERILFVTHVNAITADSRIIPERDRLIGAVKRSAADLGVDCFDPTEAMFSVGQEIALERGGTDLSHYTLAFADLVFLEMFRGLIGPRFDLSGAIDEAAISEQVREEIVAGRIGSLIDKDPALAAAELDAALARMPEARSLLEMKGRLLFATGRTDEARAILAPLAARDALSNDGVRDLLDITVSAEDWDEASTLFERLLADEVDSHRAFVLGAAVYEALGDRREAAANLQRAYLADPTDMESGLRAIELLTALEEPFRAAAMRRQIVANNTDDDANVARLRDWALANRDAEILSAAHALQAPDDFDQTAEIARQLVDFGNHDASANALLQLHALAGTDPARLAVVEDIAAQVDAWARQAARDGRPGPAYVLARAVATCRGEELAGEMVALIDAFSTRLHEAMAAKNFQQIADEGADAHAMIMDDEDLSWRYAYAVHKAGHNEDALVLLAQSRERYPENEGSLRVLGRIAAIMERFDIAVPAFTRFRDSNTQFARDYAWEIDRFFENLEKRGTKAVRNAIAARNLPLALDTYRIVAPALADRAAIEPMRLRLVRALVMEARRLDGANGMTAELESVLRDTIEIDPDNVRAIRRLARLLMDEERFGESRDLWIEAMERDPSNVSDMRNVRQCSAMMNENEGEPVSV